jgi:hypothetical protein
VDRRPLTGSIVGRSYKNKFFDFSIEFPENWAVVLVNQGPQENTKGIACILLTVGSRDKRMNGTRWSNSASHLCDVRDAHSSRSARSTSETLEKLAGLVGVTART